MFRNFNLDKVKLFDNYFAYRRNLVKQYVIEFDVNRLMRNFRINAGIKTDAEPLGGWEDPECGLRGHFTGHFLTACSRFAFADKDEFLKYKSDEIVDILESCAKPNGYLSTFGEEALDVLEAEENKGVWAPYYTLHKILQGLIDCYTFLNNKKALALAINLAHYIHGRFKKLSFWKIDGILRCTKVNPVNEFGGMGDTLYSLYEITKDEKIFELADIFNRDYFIENLAAGKDILENLHANTHLPMIIAAIHRYNLSGEMKYKTAADNFFKFIMGRTFANGNNSSKASAFIKGGVSEKSEHWGGYNDLSDALTGGESESCCAHNTEKILQYLYEWYGKVEFLDQIEILKYNAVLNSCSHETGLSQYHQPMGSNVFKKFSGQYDTFWCCTGSGIEAMSEIQKNIWLKNEDSILLNMYAASTVVWDEKNVTITQNTEYPNSLSSILTISTRKPTEFKLILKEASVRSIKINSEPIEFEGNNGFITIALVFNDKDRIEIDINASLHLIPLKGNEDMAAIMYGRILLAKIGKDGHLTGINNKNINQQLVRSKCSELAFYHVNNKETCVKFIPLFRIEGDSYSVYMNLKGNINKKTDFEFAKDGSRAYES